MNSLHQNLTKKPNMCGNVWEGVNERNIYSHFLKSNLLIILKFLLNVNTKAHDDKQFVKCKFTNHFPNL